MFKANGRVKRETSSKTIKEHTKKEFVCRECGRAVNLSTYEFAEKVMCDTCHIPMEESIEFSR